MIIFAHFCLSAGSARLLHPWHLIFPGIPIRHRLRALLAKLSSLSLISCSTNLYCWSFLQLFLHFSAVLNNNWDRFRDQDTQRDILTDHVGQSCAQWPWGEATRGGGNTISPSLHAALCFPCSLSERFELGTNYYSCEWSYKFVKGGGW